MVGDQDPLAEDLLLQVRSGLGVEVEGQAHRGRGVAGQRGAHHPRDPAGCQDAVDVGFDLRSGSAGAAPGEPIGQVLQPPGGLGQGLGEADLLGGVQAR
jgi:hypothetical protein